MNSKVAKELRRISKRIPTEYLDNLMIEQKKAPTSEKIAKLALKEASVSDEKKEKIRHILESGYFDKLTEEVEDPKIVKKLEKFWEEEIDKSIKAGRLPKPKDDKDYQSFMKKLNKYGKKKTSGVSEK